MREYELTVLLHPDLEIDADAPIAKVEKLAEKAGGKVLRRDNWGKKRLAYKIAKQDFAIYVLFVVQLEPDQVAELEREIRLTEEVIRYLLVSVEPEKPAKKKTKVKAAVAAEDQPESKESEEK